MWTRHTHQMPSLDPRSRAETHARILLTVITLIVVQKGLQTSAPFRANRCDYVQMKMENPDHCTWKALSES